MKKYIQIFAALLSTTQLFAFTPHINKGRVEEIGVAQAMRELQLSEKELKDINKEFFGILQFNKNFPPVMEADFDSPVQIFRQTFAETNEVLYRVISHAKEPEPFAHGGIFQKGYYSNGKGKPNLIFADFYDATGNVFGQSVTRVQYNYNFMPVIKKNKIAGIMIYGIERFDRLCSLGGEESWYERMGHERIVNHKAAVYWKEDFSTANLRNEYDNYADIYIKAAKPLIDENDTFRYTIQNAFDKNPATSYVEDTKDDLMYISFGTKESLQKIAIINGYAQNNDLYLKNNRVKKIGCESINDKNYEVVINDRFVLKDFITTYQVLEIKQQSNFSCIPSIVVENIYEGNKYSDTCIAEIDYFFKKDGWLFGGVE